MSAWQGSSSTANEQRQLVSKRCTLTYPDLSQPNRIEQALPALPFFLICRICPICPPLILRGPRSLQIHPPGRWSQSSLNDPSAINADKQIKQTWNMTDDSRIFQTWVSSGVEIVSCSRHCCRIALPVTQETQANYGQPATITKLCTDQSMARPSPIHTQFMSLAWGSPWLMTEHGILHTMHTPLLTLLVRVSLSCQLQVAWII